MQRHVATLLTGCLLAVSLTANARAADQINVQGEERVVAGDITATSKTEITIKAGLGSKKKERKIPANLVVSIRYDKEPLRFNLARKDEAAGRYTAALEKYTEALESKPTQFLNAEIEFRIARTNAKMALADPTKFDEALKLLNGFLAGNPTSFHYYPAMAQLGDVYLAKNDFTNAQATFVKLEAAPWTDYKMAAGTAKARLLLKQNKIGEARAAFEAVTSMPAKTAGEKIRRYDAILGKAVCLQREGKHQQAVKDLAEVSNQAPADRTRLQAEAYVRQGDSYRQIEGGTKDAILAYMHVDILFPKESALHAEALFWLSKLWIADGHPDRASNAAAKLEQNYPESEWATKLSDG